MKRSITPISTSAPSLVVFLFQLGYNVSMDILCIGCTGFLGNAVRRILYESGHQVWLVARSQPRAVRINEGVLPFDSDWMDSMSRVDAVVNLAGEPIAQWPWSPQRKHMILDSRVGLMHSIVDRLARQSQRPRIWINASAVGFYGDRGDEVLTECADAGHGFLADVAAQWESAVERLEKLEIREVRLRLGPIIGADGGMLQPLRKAFQFGLGGPLGSGHQHFPWVHKDDAARVVVWALENPIKGPVNVVAPGIVTQREFAQTLGQMMHRPNLLRAPTWALRFILGDFSELLLNSQNVHPRVLEQWRFSFTYPGLNSALQESLS